MSASYIRRLVREWCNSASVASNIPFYDTINVYGDHNDDVWFTIQFNSTDHEATFCAPNYHEVGFIDFVFMAKSGLGDLPAVTAAEVIIPTIMSYLDPSDKLSLLSHEPIQEYSRGDADSTYRIGVQVDYRYKT
jgi:hypothetical protein